MNRCFISKRACLVLALIMSFGALNSTTAQTFPETIPLPDGFQPEGITLGIGHTAYVGSLFDGSIIEVDLRTGAYGELVPAPGMIAVGLDFDERSGFLFVAGGFFGDGRVYDTETGDLVAQFPFVPFLPYDPFGSGWINDVVVTRDAAYFTNSFDGEIYKVPLGSQGLPSGGWEVLDLGPGWDFAFSGQIIINANGVVATPDGRTLIVVNYFTGRLYRVDPDTGAVTEIDLGGAMVPFGDGLVLRGKTLYVVQNFVAVPFTPPGQIAVFTLSSDYSAATLTHTFGADDPFVPSTADAFGPWLYAVNARFDACFPGPCPDVQFDIVRIDQ